MDKKILYLLGFIAMSLLSFTNCSDDDKNFSNEVYFDSRNNINQVLFREDMGDAERIMKSEIAKPETFDVTLRYEVDESKVTTYNQAYYANASLLDKKYYTLENKEDKILAGSITSSGIKITFHDMTELDMDNVYVLPVVIANSNLESLNGQNVRYFLVRGSALINVVPDMTKNWFWTGEDDKKLAKPAPLNGLTQLTMEGLVYANSFEDGNGKHFISTLMGIEGNFLLRFGDVGIPNSRLQVATSKGNIAATNDAPTEGWFHVAVTFDATKNGTVKIYINGQLDTEGRVSGLTSLDLGIGGKDGFQIGRSYEDSRYLNGMMSELRIWNIIRTQEEIAANFYEMDPKTPGLVAYWKCDEGEGATVKDHTSNENNLVSTAKDGVSWIDVFLPARK